MFLFAQAGGDAVMKKPLIIAHRGASQYAPENTVASFRKAMEMGAHGMEIDVQLSSDGYPVVIHDERVDRTSNGKGWVKDMTLCELKSLDFGSWFSPEFEGQQIPTLEEVLHLLSGWEGILNIEIKSGPVFYPGIEGIVLEQVRKHQVSECIIISSFNHYSLVEVKRMDPGIKTGVLYMSGLYEPWEYARRLGASAIHPSFYNIVPEILKGCRENGIDVNTFTVDQPEHIKNAALLGVDGIITNVPDVALRVLESIG